MAEGRTLESVLSDEDQDAKILARLARRIEEHRCPTRGMDEWDDDRDEPDRPASVPVWLIVALGHLAVPTPAIVGAFVSFIREH